MPMSLDRPAAPMDAALFTPLHNAIEGAAHKRICHSLSDEEWILACVTRVLHEQSSGRGFLQTYLATAGRTIQPSLFFENLGSKRRLRYAQSVAESLVDQLASSPYATDPFSSFGDLDNYEIFLGDGHYHEAATHDARIDETKYATGHFFGFNARTSALIHLAVADQGGTRKKEHDMRALKRMTKEQLRQGAPNGRRVIWAWDKAGIDAAFWADMKQSAGVYFVSLAKDNMRLDCCGKLSYDTSNPVNNGVTGFELVSVNSRCLRCVTYCDPATGKEFKFLTTLVDVPPGLIALIYKIRWDIEKTFDETKTKLRERKAWASSVTAKTVQATMICIAHNLLVLLEQKLEREDGIRNEKELKRRSLRAANEGAAAKAAGRREPEWPAALILRATQRTVGFIRWVRSHLGRHVAWESLTARLRAAYAGRSG